MRDDRFSVWPDGFDFPQPDFPRFDFPQLDGIDIPAAFPDPVGPGPLPSPRDFFTSVSISSAVLPNGTSRSILRAENSEGAALEIVARAFDGSDSSIDGNLTEGIEITGDKARLVNDGLIGILEPVAVRIAAAETKIVNDGTIAGGKTALLIDGVATILNSGLIDGDVRLKGGAASYDGREGKLLGILFGSEFDDVMRGGDHADTFRGRDGDDLLSGRDGDDILRGNGGDDTILGGRGADLIAPGRGSDTVTGGGGGDTFVIGRSGGDDIITDFGKGADLLDLTAFGFGSVAEVQALATERDAGLILDLAGSGGGTVLLEGVALPDLAAADILI